MIYDREHYFSCYSPKLKEYLDEFEFEPIEVFVHIKTNKTCWVYEKNERISTYLDNWTKNRNNI